MIGEKNRISPTLSKFLKENGCYAKYCYYYRKYCHVGIFNITSIPWAKTKDGVEYWRNISNKYLSFLLNEFFKGKTNGDIQGRENKETSESNKGNN